MGSLKGELAGLSESEPSVPGVRREVCFLGGPQQMNVFERAGQREQGQGLSTMNAAVQHYSPACLPLFIRRT